MEIGTLVAAISTIAIFSFLYRDNPLYRLAEHVLIGLSVGFTLVLLWNSVLTPKMLVPLFRYGNLWSLIPFGFSILMLMRVRGAWARFSKPVMALIIGAGAGLSIPARLDARILRQLSATIEPFSAMGLGVLSPAEIFNAILGLIAVVTVMVYFFYTRPDNKPVRAISETGIYFLMVFFGATFGYTVTSRLTLLIGRIEFLLSDFLGLI
jgi:hypothetical protein